MKKTRINRYTADFETLVLTEEEIKQGKSTYVWAWALCNIETLKTEYGTSLKSFIEKLNTLKNNDVIYFHNLKFDGNFIVDYLLKNDFTYTVCKDLQDKEFNCLVSEIGTWYQIQIKLNNKVIKIYDSLKKLPFSVSVLAKSLGLPEEKGCINYKEYRAEGGVLSAEDKDYIRRDVEIVARALNSVCFDKDMYKMTIGSDCMEYYKSITPKFNQFFPQLCEDVDWFCRQAYKGGYCYADPRFSGKLLKKNGCTYDYNSMYPSVMHSQSGYFYPVGTPIYFEGEYTKKTRYPLYIQHFKAIFSLKEGYTPTVQIKNKPCYKENEYITECYEPEELYMTNVDLDIFFRHYDVLYYEAIDGYMFEASIGLFDKYINHWYAFKEQATIEKNKVNRMVAKLMLNNLYGKFATNTDATKQDFYISEDSILRHYNNYNEKSGIYVPVGAFITAYARKELIEAIEANYEHFCYCDTDSIHLCCEEAKGIKVHDTKLGYWKHESDWTQAKFIRQKTYAEYIGGEWDIKAAGATDEVKKNITDINKFEIGAVYPGKKITKRVPGGLVLVDSTFRILDI